MSARPSILATTSGPLQRLACAVLVDSGRVKLDGERGVNSKVRWRLRVRVQVRAHSCARCRGMLAHVVSTNLLIYGGGDPASKTVWQPALFLLAVYVVFQW
jgi:hypothetical protein